MNITRAVAGTAILFALATGCQTRSSDTGSESPGEPAVKAVVTVFAAASTTSALDEIKAAFARHTGTEVRANYAASSALARQIENGAEVDLFISADTKWADYVEGKVPLARRRNLLGNRLVVVVPSDSKLRLSRLDELVADGVTHLAMGDPNAVPAGIYARQALTKLGLWEKLDPKIVPAEDVRQALTYVETGAAEAGIVYATDAGASKKVKVVIEIPADLTEPVLYPVLLFKRGSNEKPAADFYTFLNSVEATGIFEKHGFTVLAETGGGTK